jgi:hypothetical protein
MEQDERMAEAEKFWDRTDAETKAWLAEHPAQPGTPGVAVRRRPARWRRWVLAVVGAAAWFTVGHSAGYYDGPANAGVYVGHCGFEWRGANRPGDVPGHGFFCGLDR